VIYVLPPVVFACAALMASGGPARRAFALLLVLLGMSGPWWLPPGWLAMRGLSALCCLAGGMRGLDLVLLRERVTPLRRVGHAFSVVDSFALRRAAPHLAWRSLARATMFALVAMTGRWVAFDVAAGRLCVRWLGGLVFLYAGSEIAYALADVIYRSLGFVPPALHKHPALARSVREFWGSRWNRIVSSWLYARVHRPLARRGLAGPGMAAAFVVSALMHLYVAYPLLGPRWSLLVAFYFLVQGALALVEGPLRVARWPRVVARAWTIVVMSVTSPIMSEAFLRVTEHWP